MKSFKATVSQFGNIVAALNVNLSFESYFAIKIGAVSVNGDIEIEYLYCFPQDTCEEQALYCIKHSESFQKILKYCEQIDAEEFIHETVSLAKTAKQYSDDYSKLTLGDHENAFDNDMPSEPENGYEYRDPFDIPEPEMYEPQDADVPM